MRGKRGLFAVAAALIVATGAALWANGRARPATPGLGAEWRPTAADIAAAVGSGATGRFSDTRHDRFASLFKQRYRDRGLAVGLRFLSDRRLKVMCAAMMPRWDMAHVALKAHEETRALFGRPYDVDIYETYISAMQRKVAELRADGADGAVTVRFDDRFAAATR